MRIVDVTRESNNIFSTRLIDNSFVKLQSVTPTMWKIIYYSTDKQNHVESPSFAVENELPTPKHRTDIFHDSDVITLCPEDAAGTDEPINVRIEAITGKISFISSRTGTVIQGGWSFYNKVRNYEDGCAGSPIKHANSKNIRFNLDRDYKIFGLGEKSGLTLNKRGRTWTMWNVEHDVYNSKTDPLYQAIPFSILCTPRGSGTDSDNKFAFTGLFVDNVGRQQWDLVEEDAIEIGLFTEPIRAYVFGGATPESVLKQYTALTGKPLTLPPLYALGYQQCRWSYYPESVVRDLANQFRNKDIPCDVIYLDIHYMNKYQCFTWDLERFPDHRKMIKDLHDQHFKVVTILDPGLMVDDDYQAYRDGLEKDVYCKIYDQEGHEQVFQVYEDHCWPGKAAFPDFFQKRVRDWWGDLYHGLTRDGVDGYWNDMNEPACFRSSKTFLNHVHHVIEGYSDAYVEHEHVHNVFGMMMAKASFDGLRKLQPNKRPFLLTRAAYAGIQKYSSSWNGDNTSNWEHLQMSIPMLLNMSMSGQALVGADVGGFKEECGPELFARWMVMAALTYPIYRSHTIEGSGQQEPWSFGDNVEEISRNAIKLRYKLMPYIYTWMCMAYREGSSMIRPMFYEFPHIEECYDEKWCSTQVFLGPDLLVCPALEQSQKVRQVYLPPGTWYDFYTKKKYDGDNVIIVNVSDWSALPVFAREGAVIPMRAHARESTEANLHTPLVFEAFGEETSSFRGKLYVDDGITMEAQDNDLFGLYDITDRNGTLNLVEGKGFPVMLI
jgi:alpha-glucosidase